MRRNARARLTVLKDRASVSAAVDFFDRNVVVFACGKS